MSGVIPKAKAVSKLEKEIDLLKAAEKSVNEALDSSEAPVAPDVVKDLVEKAVKLAEDYAIKKDNIQQLLELQITVGEHVKGETEQSVDYYRKHIPKALDPLLKGLQSLQKQKKNQNLRTKH